jgi:hypothetical protein
MTKVDLSSLSSESRSFVGTVFGEAATHGGEDGGVEGGMFSSEKIALSDDGIPKSEEGADSLSSFSTIDTRRRLSVPSEPSWCFLLEYVFEYVLSGGLDRDD